MPKQKEKKKYVIMVARTFLMKHPRAGQETGFAKKIEDGDKIHTIRGNYELWRKRIEEVNKGNAVLVLKQWIEKPYRSKQNILQVLTKAGCQRIRFTGSAFYIEDSTAPLHIPLLSKNDGLSPLDFADWFNGYPVDEDMAIIHFGDSFYLAR